ncbi:hypothetical protein ElyMa_006091500, partial [Elysia marginata]
MMVKNMAKWVEEPAILTQSSYECEGVFDGEFQKVSLRNFTIILDFAAEHSYAVEKVLKACLVKMVEVARRQLTEFLDEGKYAGELDGDLRKELENRPKTNLAGEHAFGDLVHDTVTCRLSSLFNRSAKKMWKRNKTMIWLEEKDYDKKGELLKWSRKLGKRMRLAYRKREELVRLKIKEKLLENERKKHEKELNVMKEKGEIVKLVMKDGGVCETKKDVEKLKSSASYKAQLRYHKTVAGVKGLQVSGSKDQMYQRLVAFLEEGRKIKGDLPSPPRKRRKIRSQSDTVTVIVNQIMGQMYTSFSKVEEDADDGEEGEEREEEAEFVFENQGVWVAVYYDDRFYVGQVLDAQSKTTALVKFMEETKSQPGRFKWPRIDDVAEVDSSFVFRWGFNVVSTNGRIWDSRSTKPSKSIRSIEEVTSCQ